MATVVGHDRNMHPERLAFLKSINANPRDRTGQLAFADWLKEHDDFAEAFWRGGLGGIVGLVGLVGLVGIVGLVGLGGRVGLGGLGGSVGLGGLGGSGGRGGRVGLGGLGGRGGILNPDERQVVLIPGEKVLIMMPNGYGFSVLVGEVQVELPTGWIVDPCREVLDTRNGDCWVELAKGKNKKLRTDCQYGPLIDGGARVPHGCLSFPWRGELPEFPE